MDNPKNKKSGIKEYSISHLIFTELKMLMFIHQSYPLGQLQTNRVSFPSLISGDQCTRLLAQSVGHFVPRSTIAAQLGVGKISAGLF